MKPENYLNVIEKLNTELYEVGIDLFEIGFEYISTSYVDIIEFMGIQVFNSEVDCNIETEEELEVLIREHVLKITNDLCRWQKLSFMGFNLAKNETIFKQEYNCEWIGEEIK